MSSLGRLPIFAYVNAEKASLYRAVMQAFMAARERYALHLRPVELVHELAPDHRLDPADVQTLLNQLTEWGNLEAQPDTAEVRTVAEFNRPRFLYRLTREGEAAERAIHHYETHLVRPGELQITALGDIDDLLAELETLVEASTADGAKAYRTLTTLFQRLRDLTERAQTFLAGIHSTAELRGLSPEAFAAYKERLIEYLERFLGELVVRQFEIARRIQRLETPAMTRLLGHAADRELADRLDASKAERDDVHHAWHQHWQGVYRWFLPTPEGPAQAEDLRAQARAAIPAFLEAVNAINERYTARTDRRADLRALALWFAEAPTEQAAHRLWRAALGLPSPRHLRIDGETLARWDEADALTSRTSWTEAPPLYISLRLRRTGRHRSRGRPANVVDFSEERRKLARLAEAEARQLEDARHRLHTDGRLRLSQLRELEPTEFHLFLDLLGEALSAQVHPDDPVETISTDGSLLITLVPTADLQPASIPTRDGLLTGRDCWVEIRPVSAAPHIGREVTVG